MRNHVSVFTGGKGFAGESSCAVNGDLACTNSKARSECYEGTKVGVLAGGDGDRLRGPVGAGSGVVGVLPDGEVAANTTVDGGYAGNPGRNAPGFAGFVPGIGRRAGWRGGDSGAVSDRAGGSGTRAGGVGAVQVSAGRVQCRAAESGGRHALYLEGEQFDRDDAGRGSREVLSGACGVVRARPWFLRGVSGVLAWCLVLVVVLCCGLGVFVSGAVAGGVAPGWEVFGRFGPTELHPGGYGVLSLYVFNSGGGSVTGAATLVDELPPGLEAVSVMPADPQLEQDKTVESAGCSGSPVVRCEVGGVAPVGSPTLFEIPVRVASGMAPTGSGGGLVSVVSVSGGGALGEGKTRVPVIVGAGKAGFGFSGFDGWLSNADGTTDTQAGSHPYSLTIAFSANSQGAGSGAEDPTVGETHSLNVNLPPGLVGEPGVVPQCTRQQFDSAATGEGCPEASQVGEDYASVSGPTLLPFRIFNLVPPPGVAAQFAFTFSGTSVFLDAGVRSGGDNGITEHANPVAERKVVFNVATIWGIPGEHTGSGAKPFLTLPTSCSRSNVFSIEALGTWQEENAVAHENDPLYKASASFATHNNAGEEVGFTGCERLVHFQPSIAVAPDTSYADTPAGLTAIVHAPQGLNGAGLAVSGLQDTTVTLPEGVAINPGQANGLVACQPGEEGFGFAVNGEVNEAPPSCPPASKVGTDEITTPLLPDKLKGNVYVLQSNPPELQILVAASGDGVNLKLIGTVHLDPLTGRLTTTFNETPDAPFTEFALSFSGGAQAALTTPTRCGSYETSAVFVPWSAPLVADAFSSGNFQIASGPLGSPCVWPMPFAPTMTAGSTTDQAAGYTNFSMLLSRGDEQQRISTLQFKTPEGLLGMISHVSLCGEPQAALGTCPEGSRIGHTVVTAGPGPDPLQIPEVGQAPSSIYLTGPYEGAPYGLSIVVPIIAGPFTLQTQIVRARIEVDPHTSQLTITTDPLPQIVGGVPTDLRVIDAVIDRPGFMFNPSDCSPMSFSGTARSSEGATAAISSPFQVGSCQSLKFKPNFKVSTSGKPSRLNGASLDAKIVYPTVPAGNNQASSQANIARVKVELPKRLPSRLSTLQKACRALVFAANPAACPEGSIVGHATADTPVLPHPLSGPAYFVSHGGEAFPSLIVVLQGEGITVDLEGTTFISKKGITTSTFKSVPDVPVSTFELVLPKGPHSALAANGNLCKGTLTLPTEFLGQNGALIKQNTKINVTDCPKKHKQTKHNNKKNKNVNVKKKGTR